MAVTANQIMNRREGCRLSYPAAVANLYEGTLCFVNAAGYGDIVTLSGANQFGGIVIQQQDNSAGSAGDLDVECYAEGEFLFTGTGFAQADIGQTLYATDNFTTGTAASGVPVGEITRYVSTTQVWAKISVLTGGGANVSGGTQTVTPNSGSEAASLIQPGVTRVAVAAVTNGVTDFIVLPALAEVAIGHEITILCNAGGAFEIRTPAASNEEINSEDCDGTKEYLATDTQVIKVIKISDTIGWMAHAYSALGAVVAAVVPD